MFDAATAAVEGALAAGAGCAGAGVVARRYESMAAKNGDIETLVQGESFGVGVRALVGSSWGFQAVAEPDGAAAGRAGAGAAGIARASATVPGAPVELVPVEVRQDSWASGCELDPRSVSWATKGDLLVGVTTQMRAAGADLAEAFHRAWDTRTWLVSSEGHRIDQHIRECGAGMNAVAVGERETHRRPHPPP